VQKAHKKPPLFTISHSPMNFNAPNSNNYSTSLQEKKKSNLSHRVIHWISSIIRPHRHLFPLDFSPHFRYNEGKEIRLPTRKTNFMQKMNF